LAVAHDDDDDDDDREEGERRRSREGLLLALNDSFWKRKDVL
jgi:hypothetical protein